MSPKLYESFCMASRKFLSYRVSITYSLQLPICLQFHSNHFACCYHKFVIHLPSTDYGLSFSLTGCIYTQNNLFKTLFTLKIDHHAVREKNDFFHAS